MQKNTALSLFLLILFLLGIFVFLYSPVIFQEGNPLPQLNGIIKLNFGKENIVKLNTENNRYMSKSKNASEMLKEFMKERNYEFVEQLGSGYFFKSDKEENVVITHRHYSKLYSIWNFPDDLSF